MSGTGVTAANDQALLLCQENATVFVVMREGDPVQHGATVGVISRVEVAPYGGRYAVLVTLAGAPVGTEQALFIGFTPMDYTARIHPSLYLRKGWTFDNQPGKVRSISLPNSNIPPSGVGCTGRGRSISWDGDLAITVEFDNGARQIMKGLLP